MKRRLFAIVAALSLVLSAATCVLGIRSYQEEHEFEFANLDISLSRGEILAGIRDGYVVIPPRHFTETPSDLIAKIESANHCGGHGFYLISEDGRGQYVSADAVALPWWCACLILMVPALVRLLPRRQPRGRGMEVIPSISPRVD